MGQSRANQEDLAQAFSRCNGETKTGPRARVLQKLSEDSREDISWDIDLSLTAVTDIEVKEVVRQYLASCKIADNAVQELARGCPNLKEVDLSDTKVTDVGVEELAKVCPSLTNVSLAYCKITDIGVKELVCHCCGLEAIDLSLTKVTDKIVSELARG